MLTPREILDRLRSALDYGEWEDVCRLADDLEKMVAGKVGNIYDGKPIVLVDFDGVIHSYKSGWKGIDQIPDPPNEGAINWLRTVNTSFDIRIFSARCNDLAGIAAMIRWFRKWGLTEEEIARLRFEAGKPSAYLIVDDRAACFDGDFSKLSAEAIRGFRPWYYKHAEWNR